MAPDRLGDLSLAGAPLDLGIGAEYHGYVVTGRLHVGADGELYAARSADGEPCAIKIPLGEGLGNLRRYASFNTEWTLAGRLSHAYVVNSRRGEGRFLVMELLEGSDLRSELHPAKRWEWEEVERMLGQICAGLRYLHAAGVVHHDLKPENIMIDREKGVKILDFGLAWVRGMDDPLGVLDEPLGTPYYIPPEQLEGVRGHAASDMYSLGVILYEMLTGQLPFSKSRSPRGARNRLYMEPVPPRIHRPDLPCGIQELLYLLLDRDPFARPSAERLCQVIEARIDWTSIACVTPDRSPLDRWMDNFRRWKSPRYRELLPEPTGRVHGCHVLAGIHDSEVSDRVIHAAMTEARQRGATVTLLGVVPQNLPEFDAARAEEALIRKIDEGLSILRDRGVLGRFRLKYGDPAKEILAYAASRNVDLVVLAPRDLRGLRRIRDGGGVTQRIVSRAPCNVLVVRGPTNP